MAKASKKTGNDAFATFVVVKAHDGLMKGEVLRRKANDAGALYCVEKGLWKIKKEK